MKKRRFFADALQHVYFITRDGGVLFYTTSDRLAFYTLVSVLSKRYGVVVVGMCIMFTHVHLLVRATDLSQFRLFMGQLLKALSKIICDDRTLRGPLLKRPFGSAPLVSSKRQRSSLIYLYNNPVEKRLCTKAIEDRWTFLAYYGNAHPFSAPLVLKTASRRLRDACRLVTGEAAAGRYMRPALVRGLFRDLTQTERRQLSDFIISRYAFIDFAAAVSLFGSFDHLVRATESTTGQEFDIGEEWDPTSDVAYREMTRMAAEAGLLDNWSLLHLSAGDRAMWARNLRVATGATEHQVRRFLHGDEVPPGKNRDGRDKRSGAEVIDNEKE